VATVGAGWLVVNDGVMGGVSTSQIMSDADGVHFSGEVRTEFNGGFASARRAVDATALRAALTEEPVGLALVVRGDGHRYRLTVYPSDGRGGVRAYSYYAPFGTTAGVEQSHTLRWPAFRATFRGRAISDAPPLVWRDVVGVGLMLTKDGHREGRGPFELHLVSLRPASPGT
jgi:monofunctional biosynthetic peptidoglycan transglycosylase